MYIKDIKLTNFRCCKFLEVSFPEKLAVIAGNNASGKSSLLDGISIALGAFLSAIDSTQKNGISKEDVLTVSYSIGSVIDLQPRYPVSISSECNIGGNDVLWTRTLESANGRTKLVDDNGMKKLAESYSTRIANGDTTLILPVISYYGTGRLWAQKKEKRDTEQLQKFNRLSGYIDCLSAESNEKMMLKWFQKMTIQEAQNKAPIPELTAVKSAITACFQRIKNCNNAEAMFNLDTHDIDIVYPYSIDEGSLRQRFPMKQLSDGYKNTISMIADIAYRMAVLNPQLLDNILTTPGIVLIDEVDLHLHPKWQRRIIGDLQSIFPNVQFIVTTHAPAVINSVKRGNLLVFSNNRTVYSPQIETYGRDVNSILREIMDVGERPDDVRQLFDEFYKSLSERNFEQSEKKLNDIEKKIGGDDPELIGCRTSLELEKLDA